MTDPSDFLSQAPPPQPPPIPRPWHVEVNGQAQGPFTRGDLARMAGEGRLKPQTLVWKEGMSGWKEAQYVGELASLMVVRPLPPRPMAPPPSKPGMPVWVMFLIIFVCLIPVAGILAAIAVPNFLEAQTRSKIARAKGDLRTMTIALETYYLDHNAYPTWTADCARKALGEFGEVDQPGFAVKSDRNDQLATLTTPVAYITRYFVDPFSPTKQSSFSYWSPAQAEKAPGAAGAAAQTPGYIIWSAGPDMTYDLNVHNITEYYDPAQKGPSPALIEMSYDPSNGTVSRGDLWRIKQ